MHCCAQQSCPERRSLSTSASFFVLRIPPHVVVLRSGASSGLSPAGSAWEGCSLYSESHPKMGCSCARQPIPIAPSRKIGKGTRCCPQNSTARPGKSASQQMICPRHSRFRSSMEGSRPQVAIVG